MDDFTIDAVNMGFPRFIGCETLDLRCCSNGIGKEGQCVGIKCLFTNIRSGAFADFEVERAWRCHGRACFVNDDLARWILHGVAALRGVGHGRTDEEVDFSFVDRDHHRSFLERLVIRVSVSVKIGVEENIGLQTRFRIDGHISSVPAIIRLVSERYFDEAAGRTFFAWIQSVDADRR